MKKLRSGYTTGACAAAAAKAAAVQLFTGKDISNTTIPFPDGSRVEFKINYSETGSNYALAAVKKDAGDDPDVTNRAIIAAKIRILDHKVLDKKKLIQVVGGKGVGIVTKPGLPVAVGLSAINPIPMQMIQTSVLEAVSAHKDGLTQIVEVTIIVPRGEFLAKKTLNKRLGIVGGISILGTTGIVRPLSADAWTGTISSSMNVATATGVDEIILSTGRSSERCVQEALKSPEEALIMMGDYLEFALKETQKHSFRVVHMAAMWAKLLKGAMKIPQTHVRHGALEIKDIVEFLRINGIEKTLLVKLEDANTAREVLERLLAEDELSVIKLVCKLAKDHYTAISGANIKVHLVQGSGKLLYSC